MRLTDDQVTLTPSDLSGFLACEHLATLDLTAVHGKLERPVVDDDQRELIQRKGEEHERGYLDQLRAEGRDVVEIQDGNWDERVALTEQALRNGADVVYQGTFEHGRWRGVADFILCQPGGGYEVLDTKLARSAKPSYILQLCFYNEQVARVQGHEPARIHVLLGSGELVSFRPQEFGAYYRRVRSRLEDFVDVPRPTVAWPCDHCGVCDFKPVCDAHWDEIDHLSRVAGISRVQIEKLFVAGIATLGDLGRAEDAPPPPGIAAKTWEKIQDQAALQLASRETGDHHLVVLPPQPGTGFSLLPEPSAGDLFFDFEGNPFWDKDGSLEYLWGILDADRNFTPIHAYDHESERAALETFVDLVHARLREYPDLHVYHYASYEIAALKRMMGRYGTREDEVDDLLRRGVFVDLLAVVRNGIRASRPGYGLKEMEVFLDFERRAEVKDGGTSIVVFERWMQTHDPELLRQIDEYNEEDCIATLLLRDWLLGLKRDALAQYGPFPPVEGEEPRPMSDAKVERTALQQQLIDADQEVAAHLLDYHAREHKPVWWWFYERIEKTPDELLEDAESIGGLESVGAPVPLDQSFADTFTFPPQEFKLGKGQDVRDPATGNPAGALIALDRDRCILVLKRGRSFREVALPLALIPGGPFNTNAQEEALERFGRSVLAGDNAYPALESILRREPFDREIQTTDLDEMKALVRSLDGRHLVIQGPPGSGKTWTSGRLIADLIEHGKTVGVASTSHKAIHKLLDEVEDAAAEIRLDFKGLKKASGGNSESAYDQGHFSSVTESDDCADVDVTGGTAWHYARRNHDRTLDYLFIDEAGQVSLADALAMGTCARNVVLVGDPQQLPQVIQGTHPLDTDKSVLTWLIGDAETIPPDRGLFLERTFRLHPDVCAYISDEFYEGRLQADPVTAGRTTPLGTGLRYVAVEHEANRQESAEEVEAVRGIIGELLAAGVAAREVMVVSPYNAQVNLLREALPPGVAVGTVDKFQGQEADVVVYSMASSSGADVPHGLEFLLSRNRLNVAMSRARCLAYLVASPRLLEVNCRTIDQMRLANALCRFAELAS
jgi:predicted RecB family nuclease